VIPIVIVLKYIFALNATNHYVVDGSGSVYP
jgi:hypothetical protein